MAPKKTKPVSIRLSEETSAQLDELSKAWDLPKSRLMNEALQDYCDYQIWKLRAIEEGIQQADRGELIPFEAVKAEWEQRLRKWEDEATHNA